jgi:hypothetical protein
MQTHLLVLSFRDTTGPYATALAEVTHCALLVDWAVAATISSGPPATGYSPRLTVSALIALLRHAL